MNLKGWPSGSSLEQAPLFFFLENIKPAVTKYLKLKCEHIDNCTTLNLSLHLFDSSLLKTVTTAP